MGCASSKKAGPESSPSPPHDLSSVNASFRLLDSVFSTHNRGGSINGNGNGNADNVNHGLGNHLERITEEPEKEEKVKEHQELARRSDRVLAGTKSSKTSHSDKRSVFSFRFGRITEAEQAAAGWPTWLSAVAGEAVQGWVPLRSDTFERLEKIGQGTYSSVYRARNVQTGRMVALKKVRFDNFQPESVRFMAREITVLRMLDHPNIMKLEGIITSRLSCSIYLVFEYMEHDLSGLLSCPDIKFSDAQIKCYMWQLLCGLEHCHSRGIVHRDIKTSNILVNNEGVLKIADFGLANFYSTGHKQPLTSRVVTLWYRPPELLLGSTDYGASVDLWSVGCVLAELFIGRPILKGRTEVEQLHKIFKLCGSPPDEYWKKSKLPLATMFKPQSPYESTLRERCREFPKTAVKLIEQFLSIDPHKRGTASSALDSEYFTTRPYACEPSSIPKYPPNKEIDAKFRDEARRKKAGAKVQDSGTLRNPRRVRRTLQEESTFCKVVPTEGVEANIQVARRNYDGNGYLRRGKGATESRGSGKSLYDTRSEISQSTEASHVTEASQADSIRSVPVIAASSSFSWAKKRKPEAVSTKGQATSRSHLLDPSVVLRDHGMLETDDRGNEDFDSSNQNEIAKPVMRRQKSHTDWPDSFDSHDLFQHQELSLNRKNQRRVRFSGPLLSQTHKTDRRWHESHAGQSAGRSRFYTDSGSGNA